MKSAVSPDPYKLLSGLPKQLVSWCLVGRGGNLALPSEVRSRFIDALWRRP